MKHTENTNLPEPLYRALTESSYNSGADQFPDKELYSVTTLISPPQIIQLTRRYQHEIEIDPWDNWESLLGRAIHNVIESKSGNIDEIAELRLFKEINGVIVSGAFDHFSLEHGTLTDWKVTKAGVAVYGAKEDWTPQLNLYAHFLRLEGHDVKRLQIVALFRDHDSNIYYKGEEKHKKFRSGTPEDWIDRPDDNADYTISLWDDDKISKYIADRVAAHEAARVLPDDQLPPCSNEERWLRSKYILRKQGDPKAKVVRCQTHQIAEQKLAELNDPTWIIEEIPGKPIRCLDWCIVSEHCAQWAADKKNYLKDDSKDKE